MPLFCTLNSLKYDRSIIYGKRSLLPVSMYRAGQVSVCEGWRPSKGTVTSILGPALSQVCVKTCTPEAFPPVFAPGVRSKLHTCNAGGVDVPGGVDITASSERVTVGTGPSFGPPRAFWTFFARTGPSFGPPRTPERTMETVFSHPVYPFSRHRGAQRLTLHPGWMRKYTVSFRGVGSPG